MSLEVGDIAPDFSLKNQFGEVVTLSEFKGKNRSFDVLSLRFHWQMYRRTLHYQR